MDIIEKLNEELRYINDYQHTAITINSTARSGQDFAVLPRRYIDNTAIVSFLIDEHDLLLETLHFFDGQVDTIYVDVERKKNINLFKVAKETVKHSKLSTLKPNDTTIEACDLLIRQQFDDDLEDKTIFVIGTGNLASKITLKLSERQANLYMLGRTKQKEATVIEGLNTFIPGYSKPIHSFSELTDDVGQADVIIAFISGQFKEEAQLLPYVGPNTMIIDGGINNFSGAFIQQANARHATVTRLDVRLGLPYQFLSTNSYTTAFFRDVYGQSEIKGVSIISGGFIGGAGSIIVDNIRQPNQVVGVADGMGGLKKHDDLTTIDKQSAKIIRNEISAGM